MANIINILSTILFLLCWFLIIKKLLWNRFAPVKTVKAEVVDKYRPNDVSKYPKQYRPKRFVIVFKTKEETLSFNVSEFSYKNYQLKKKGTLKYKGSQIISFK